MGIVSDEEFERERKNSDPEFKSPPVIAEIVEMNNPGRSPGDTNVPDSLRKIIGGEAIENGRQSALQLARNFGISESSVGAYTQGATSPNSYNQRPNNEFLSGIRNKITKKASKKLITAIDSLTDEKIMNSKAITIANIAKALSGIVKDMTPEMENLDKPIPPQIVVLAPTVHKEDRYEMIFAKE